MYNNAPDTPEAIYNRYLHIYLERVACISDQGGILFASQTIQLWLGLRRQQRRRRNLRRSSYIPVLVDVFKLILPEIVIGRLLRGLHRDD